MIRYSRALGAILTAALLAACSGGAGGGVGSNSATLLPSSKHVGTGHIKARIHIPALKTKKHAHLRAHWLPSSATEIDFQLTAVNGDNYGIGYCNVGQGYNCYNFAIYTGGSNAGGCTSDGSGGYVCNVSEPAPAATDTYQITAGYCSGKINADGSCGAPGGLNALSMSNTTLNVPLNGNVTGNFTLNPVVANLQWSASGIQVGSGQPFATGQLAGNPVVQIQALDAYGDVIIGATTDPSGNYNTALYLDGNGNVDNVYWNCSDPSVSFETGGGPYSPLQGYRPLSQETIANGFYPYGYDLKNRHSKTHRPHDDGPVGINSPEANPQNDYDGGNWGTGTDGNGNAVAAVGNNGTEINYDGTSPLDLSTQFQCNAADDEGNSAQLTVSLGNGSITWTTNHVHAPGHRTI
ncbi:MAG: hypothetical protein JO199_13110 [Candidatus Eremiobacteraeota bacterium]|nr:hypothetical protein [Candidatus Eremiobacteraeota bacterium]